MNKIDKQLVEQVTWEQDPDTFDDRLHALGQHLDEFVVVNPRHDPWILDYVDLEVNLDSDACIVWAVDNTWLIKKFTKNWTPAAGWHIIHCEIELDLEVEFNSAVKDFQFNFKPTINIDNADYEHIWYLDVAHSADYHKVWVAKAKVKGCKVKGTMDMGRVSPVIEYNSDLALWYFNVDTKIPYYDMEYDHVWYLDPAYNPDPDKIWVVKIPSRNSKGTKDNGYVSPVIEYNPDLSQLIFDDVFVVPYHNMEYDHVWYLDPAYNPDQDKIWVAQISSRNSKGTTDHGYVSPVIEYNPDLSSLKFNCSFAVPYNDMEHNHVWYLDPTFNNTDDKIWVARIAVKEPQGTKDHGYVSPVVDNFDVVFISYNEPNAEANWQRVVELAPKAKRVKGVKGIFHAHKAAAELATTPMFYVVDGDAELVDNWKFDFRPDIFDLDCVHLWTSINPINDLEYGYGGVKLFPRQVLLDAKTWNIDLTTGLGKLKLVNKISNISAFNTDAFSTWRSAFRECAKLSSGSMLSDDARAEALPRLETWTTQGQNRPYGQYAIDGACAGRDYGFANHGDTELMKLINDYEWMKNEFDKFYSNGQQHK